MTAKNINNSPSVLENKYSRYVCGGTTETSELGIGWWERKKFSTDASDRIYFVEKKFENRLDLISAKFYGDARYAWCIAQYNNILDPYFEIIHGRRLLIPSKDRILTEFISGK